MAKKKTEQENQQNEIQAFSFGDPENVHNDRILDYLGVFMEACGEFYVPPISLSGLAKMRRANAQHGSCILFRRNMAANAYTRGILSINEFEAVTTDYLSFGHAYMEKLFNKFGQVSGLRHLPALNMRVRTQNKGYRQLLPNCQYIDFAQDEIFEIAQYDEMQQIYGVPDWLGGMQSALLNEAATLFRRRYYINGAHVGYILYTNDPKMHPEIRKKLEENFRQGKGVGNFKASYINIPGGAEKAIQIIPIGDISQKDEFANIKNISANDVFMAHRVPPALMGVIPNITGGFGDPEKIERVYLRTEVKSLCRKFIELNKELPGSMRFEFNFKPEGDSDGANPKN